MLCSTEYAIPLSGIGSYSKRPILVETRNSPHNQRHHANCNAHENENQSDHFMITSLIVYAMGCAAHASALQAKNRIRQSPLSKRISNSFTKRPFVQQFHVRFYTPFRGLPQGLRFCCKCNIVHHPDDWIRRTQYAMHTSDSKGSSCAYWWFSQFTPHAVDTKEFVIC